MSYKRISPQTIIEGGTGVQSNTAYAVLCGGTTSIGAIQSVASVGSSGQLLTSNGVSALPTFQTAAASSISITGDTGGALTGNAFTFTGSTTGLTFAGSGSTETLGGTLVVSNGGTGVATLAADGVVYGNGTSAVGVTAAGASGTVLIGTTSAAPSFSATPTLTSVTFGAGSALNSYVGFTGYTPTLLGSSTAGTTSYSIQNGFYNRIGSIINVAFTIAITAATGTGNIQISIPFAASNTANYVAVGSVSFQGAAYTWPTSYFMANLYLTGGNSFVNIIGTKTLSNGSFFQMASTSLTISGSIIYSV